MIDGSALLPNRIRRLATAIVLVVALASMAQSAHAVLRVSHGLRDTVSGRRREQDRHL